MGKKKKSEKIEEWHLLNKKRRMLIEEVESLTKQMNRLIAPPKGKDMKIGRILRNRNPYTDGARDVGDIDEIVLLDVESVHVEQMDNRCWWIGIHLNDHRGYWSGNFTADSRGRMSFWEQDCDFEWDEDKTHA